MQYHAQLKHPFWQKKRLEVMEHHNFTCQICDSKEETLNVHHPFYKRGALLWEYGIEELMCLCEKCHKDAHATDEKIRKLLSHPRVWKREIIGILKAMINDKSVVLDDWEEVNGFTRYYGISTSHREYFTELITENEGKPYSHKLMSALKAEYDDIGQACEGPDDFKEVMEIAQKINSGHWERLCAQGI